MQIINLDEERLKRDIRKAMEALVEARTLISYGKYELVDQAKELENLILKLETKLVNMIDTTYS
mgnify:CR=1 FL=1|tara:strand:- start:2770 stop:2961 length:192 start_codon:yes stop_codon:yes gene_type:complete